MPAIADTDSATAPTQPDSAQAPPTRALIVTRVIEPGGAERQLIAFLREVDPERLKVAVAAYYRGDWHDQAAAIPLVDVHDLHKRGRYDLISFGSRLWSLARSFRPDVVYGYQGGWLPALAVAKSLRVPAVWGLRNSEPASDAGSAGQRLIDGLNRTAAPYVDAFIANSEAGAAAYAAAGYPADRIAVIPNGIDTARFFRDDAARQRLRTAWHIGDGQVLVGLVGRLDRRKNYEDVIRVAGRLAAADPALRFVHAGSGDTRYLVELQSLAAAVGMGDRFTWAGHVETVSDVYSALDVFVLPSTTEGFPNALCEAMACELPVVANDVGDSRQIVGDAGFVVPPGDDLALAAVLSELTSPESPPLRHHLGLKARKRIEEIFGVRRMAQDTTSHLERIAMRQAPSVPPRPGNR